MNEHTTFDEKIVENEAQLPSFTLCPTEPDDIFNISIESFEDVEKEIEKIMINYNIKYTEHKPYEEFKTVEEKYNGTSNGVWYFAPKISIDSPFEAVICMIWTPSKDYKLKPDWSISVSCFVNLALKSYAYLYLILVHDNHGFITISMVYFAISPRSQFSLFIRICT